jgi:hypothetical protein
MDRSFEWKCPKCGADANEHGTGGSEKCKDSLFRQGNSCQGFLCECPDSGESLTHGQLLSDVCEEAVCHHCGWSGKFPRLPGKILPWEKKALAAGWNPPDGWGKRT